jgi:ABC-2 type transport system permease protein
MLWYKAWRESRMRFVIALVAVAGLCALFVFLRDAFQAGTRVNASESTYIAYVYRRVYAGFVRGIFLVLGMVLGLGGLQRERAHGTIGFTLGLPVSRRRLESVRAMTGLLEVSALAWLPALLVPGLSLLVGQRYPWSQAFEFAMLWTAVGAVVFAAAFFASSALRSEYSALTTSLLAFYIYPLVVVKTPFLQGLPLHIHYIMNGTGMPYFDARARLLTGPFPWTIVASVAVVTLTFLVLAIRVTERTDFA